MGKLSGKVALITGGSEGIGFATADLFVREGAQVYITGRRQGKLEEAVKKIGKGVIGICADSSKMSDIKKTVSQIQNDAKHLDILFANAGSWEPGHVESVTEEDFDNMINTNVKGVFFLVKEALSIFNNKGSIVLNGSVASFMSFPNYSVYSATKAAMRSFSKSWSVDLKDRKIRVNTISPGAIDTAMMQKEAELQGNPEEFVRMVKDMVLLGRVGQSEDVAKTVLFLASDDSSYITASDICIDGGLGQV